MPKPKDFYTDEQGRPRPITKKRGGAVVAGAIALGVAAGGGGLVTGGLSGGSTMYAKAAEAAKAAAKGNYRTAWRRVGGRMVKRSRRFDLSCAVHSYGQVRVFFLATPCLSLRRMLFTVDDGGGNTMAVWVAWVRMPSVASVARLHRLANRYGTGNVAPIGKALLEAQGVAITGQHYEDRVRRRTVTIAEAEPLSGAPTDETLDGAAYVASRFPRP